MFGARVCLRFARRPCVVPHRTVSAPHPLMVVHGPSPSSSSSLSVEEEVDDKEKEESSSSSSSPDWRRSARWTVWRFISFSYFSFSDDSHPGIAATNKTMNQNRTVLSVSGRRHFYNRSGHTDFPPYFRFDDSVFLVTENRTKSAAFRVHGVLYLRVRYNLSTIYCRDVSFPLYPFTVYGKQSIIVRRPY